MDTLNIPPGVEITVGYKNGIRTYRRGDAVLVEDGMTFLGAKTIRTTNPATAAATTPIPQLTLYIGLCLLAYHQFGAVGLVTFGIIMMWAMAVWKRAKEVNANSKNIKAS